jgi:DNA-binding transcriptional MerR regulator
MQRRKFRIGELAKQLGIERFVVRFWEKEFSLKTTRSDGGQRFFDEKDFEKFKLIKTLLYERGFTIAGAKQEIARMHPPKVGKVLASSKTTMGAHELSTGFTDSLLSEKEELTQQIAHLKDQLRKLRELL